MPSSTDAQRALMTDRFGSADISGPLRFLRSHGFIEQGGFIQPPVQSHTLSNDERECISFLVREWDFGYGW